MKRRLFTILSAISLLLFVAVAIVFFMALGDRRYSVALNTPAPTVHVAWGGGGIWVWYIRAGYGYWHLSYGAGELNFPLHQYSSKTVLGRIGVHLSGGPFRITSETPQRVVTYSAVSMPSWLPLSLSALLPAVWVGLRIGHALRYRSRISLQLCPSCGYDLRATPGRCPECGLVPAAPPPPLRGNVQ